MEPTMSQITIRRLDAAVLQGLKSRAAAAGHSMEQEARKILEAAVLPSSEGVAERLRVAMAGRKPGRGETYSDSALLVRRARAGWPETKG
jgi:plasmid stability protein